jgi:2-dehydro-3-deoxyphosphooctonate aldolase (KDO 8-P synthase)
MDLFGHRVGGKERLFFIAGPCAIEGRDHALYCADKIRRIADLTGALFIYKSSFDKANRTSADGFRGVGMEEGLRILEDVRAASGLPVVTDVHEREQAAPVAEVVDMLQTPAFLARQTDFVQAVAATGCPVNIKKGQFMAPGDMRHVADKARRAQPEGAGPIMLCERGTSFGYGNLVVDMRGLKIMAETGLPVVFDATHSVQLPSANGGSSGGERAFIPTLAAAAVATGHVAGVFMETHPDPDNAPCDGPNALPLDRLAALAFHLLQIKSVAGQ